jgi:Protein of unknown function (DUF2914)
MQRVWGWLALAVVAAPLAAQGGAPAASPPAAPSRARAGSLTVTEAVIARAVVDRSPQDTGSAFPADVGQLNCFTEVNGGGADTLHHVWFHGDTQVADVALPVNGSPWHTWSRKTVPADWTGPWHVEIQDASGTVLKRLDFSVGP